MHQVTQSVAFVGVVSALAVLGGACLIGADHLSGPKDSVDAGTSTAAQSSGSMPVAGCETDADCDDSDDCTKDTCVKASSTCDHMFLTYRLCSSMGVSSGFCDPALQACKSFLSQGTSCTVDVQCGDPGYCTDGVCCEKRCDATCYQCNGSPLGLCNPVGKLEGDHDSDCDADAGKACNGAGACGLASGQPCSSDKDCASAKCSIIGTCDGAH